MVIVIHFKVKVSRVEGFLKAQIIAFIVSVKNYAGHKSWYNASMRWADQCFNIVYHGI